MIIIIDFGSQYNQLIARRVRECHIYCQILPPDTDIDYVRSLKPEGIILSVARQAFTKSRARGWIEGYSVWASRFWVFVTACNT